MTYKKKKRLLINCANLHIGGGVAVATSFIDCLSRLEFDDIEICLLLSSSVDRNLKSLGTNMESFSSCFVIDYLGLDALWRGLHNHFRNFDLVFTVFGPVYFLFSNAQHIVGFAQPNIIYPVNPISIKLGLGKRLRLRAKYKIQELFFSKARSLIVELEHVERGLRKKFLFRKKRIYIVYSAVHSIYMEPERWESLYIPESDASIKLGIISRNYPHKNLKILPRIKDYLWDNHGLKVDFYVTFQPSEWLGCDSEFKRKIINVGGLTLNQCPSFYSLMDGVIFPSLLECFSAVPIEAMMVKKPLFASDLPFIRDVCGNFCNYFNPLDPQDIAKVICEYFNRSEKLQNDAIEKAYHHVQKYPGPIERANHYMRIIRNSMFDVQ